MSKKHEEKYRFSYCLVDMKFPERVTQKCNFVLKIALFFTGSRLKQLRWGFRSKDFNKSAVSLIKSSAKSIKSLNLCTGRELLYKKLFYFKSTSDQRVLICTS